MATIVSVDEYRQLLEDEISTDEEITKRIEYLEALCRNIIREELKKYDNETEGL